MQRHPLRVLRESNAGREQLHALLAPDVVFHSPIFRRPIRGRDLVAEVMFQASALREGRYLHEFRDEAKTVLIWEGIVNGETLQSFELIEDDEHGLIKMRTVAMRPYHALTVFREAMRNQLQDILPADVW